MTWVSVHCQCLTLLATAYRPLFSAYLNVTASLITGYRGLGLGMSGTAAWSS